MGRRRKSRFIHLTGWGKGLLLFSALILLAAFITGRNVIYLLFSVMVSFIFVSSVLATISLHGLRLERILPQHIFSGKPFLVETKVRNNKEFFSSFSLTVSNLFSQKELKGQYILKLPAKSSVSLAHKYLIERRGRYTFHGIKVATTYPLDLFLKGYVVKAPETILVYPRIVRLNPNFLNAMVAEIENQVNRAGLGTDLYGFRKYEEGDDSRFINWKLSAKTQSLLVTSFCQEQNLRVCVVFDNLMRRKDGSSREEFERAVTLAASLCSFFVGAGYKVKLVSRSEEIPYGEGNKQLYQMLSHLAVIEPASDVESVVNPYSRDVLESGTGLLVYCEEKPRTPEMFSRVFDAGKMEGI